jgi:hypothetical protein
MSGSLMRPTASSNVKLSARKPERKSVTDVVRSGHADGATQGPPLAAKKGANLGGAGARVGPANLD